MDRSRQSYKSIQLDDECNTFRIAFHKQKSSEAIIAKPVALAKPKSYLWAWLGVGGVQVRDNGMLGKQVIKALIDPHQSEVKQMRETGLMPAHPEALRGCFKSSARSNLALPRFV